MIKTLTTLEDYKLHERLGYQMARLEKLMAEALAVELAEYGVNVMQWCVLSGVAIENHNTPSDLAQHIGVSRPCLSRALKAMDTNGLIERNLIGGDGRTRTISLTEKGQEMLTRCWAKIQKVDERFSKKLNATQFEMIASSVDAMLEGEVVELDFLK